MAFERPTLSKLVRRAKADISTRLVGADASVRGTPEEVLAITLAGMTHGVHGHVKWLSRQILTDLSDEDFLLREASVYGLERTQATFAEGEVTITGTNGETCPDETVWERADGVRYVQSGAAEISGGQATITVVAEESGEDGNADVGTQLTLAAPVSGINSTGTVSGSGITGGVDIEDVEDLRTRLLERKQTPPKGGGPGDYVAWAKEVSGVTRAWQYANQFGPGTVLVLFVMDDLDPIIPDAGAISDVQTYVDTKAPITADVTVDAPIALELNPQISITPDTADIRAAVEAELLDYLTRTAEPGDGVGLGTVYLSQLNEAISVATGEEDHTLVSPVADVVPAEFEIVVLGTITWS